MATLRQQTDAKMDQTRQKNPEFAKAVDALLVEAKALQQGEKALPVGAQAPDFALPNATGDIIKSTALKTKGAIVVTFYRGSWCPYCNLQMKALSDRLSEIHEYGAELVAISPQLPDESLSIVEKQALTFPVLSDQDAKVAESFGVAWHVPDILVDHMRDDRGLDLEKINNGNDSILPIPATFIIQPDGKIAWRFVDVDYRNRSEPEDIIQQLRKINKK